MMAHLTPVRDEAGGIIGLLPKDDESVFGRTLTETIAALSAQSAPAATPAALPEPAARSPRQAMIALGLVAALILVAGLNLLRTPAPALPAQHAAPPTAAPRPPARTQAPTGTPTATPAPTATPDPPTPIIIIQPAPPPIQCYSVTLSVTNEHGTQIGIATGESCESREAAQANAETEAGKVRANYERR